jgi:hypothetical protein
VSTANITADSRIQGVMTHLMRQTGRVVLINLANRGHVGVYLGGVEGKICAFWVEGIVGAVHCRHEDELGREADRRHGHHDRDESVEHEEQLKIITNESNARVVWNCLRCNRQTGNG